MRRSTAVPPLLLLLLLALAGCTGGGGGGPSGGGPATTSAPAEAPAETRTVTERPSATVTERAPASPPAPATTTVQPPPDVAPQGRAESCPTTADQPVLRTGSTGPAVLKAQCYLNLALAGAPIPEDGDFGPVTDEAVRRFQTCAGLTVDGVVGPQTWPELVFWADAGPVC